MPLAPFDTSAGPDPARVRPVWDVEQADVTRVLVSALKRVVWWRQGLVEAHRLREWLRKECWLQAIQLVPGAGPAMRRRRRAELG